MVPGGDLGTLIWLVVLTGWLIAISILLRRSARAAAGAAPDEVAVASSEAVSVASLAGAPAISAQLENPVEAVVEPTQPSEEPAERGRETERRGKPRRQTGNEDDLLADYNRLAADYAQDEVARFRQRWHPQEVETGEDGGLALGSGELWFVSLDEDGRGVLVPGPEVIRTWDRFYRQMSGMQARSLLGAIYDIDTGATLRITRFATARREAGRIVAEVEGALSGI